MRFLGIFSLLLLASATADSSRGKAIYREYCLDCHGETGEGVGGEYELPLTGDDPLPMLTAIIHRTMPEEDPKEVSNTDAKAVAAYMYDAFYSREAWQRVHPAKIEHARLTPRQFETAVTDLVGSFTGATWPGKARGLRKDKTGRLTGSILAERTGEYEFVVYADQPFRLWINDLDNPLLDSAEPMDRKTRSRHAHIRLLAGRAYPIILESPVPLHWRPPQSAETVLADRNTIPELLTSSLVVASDLPSDRRLGYWQGNPVSPAYLEAIAVASESVADALADQTTDWQEFAERAFRRPLIAHEAKQFLAEDPQETVRRVLTSPNFLYPESPSAGPYRVAARLAFTLWGSLPDAALRSATDKLANKSERIAQAERMLRSPQTRTKMRRFFEDWLQLKPPAELGKDETLFPGFDVGMATELRRSLDHFLDESLWSGSADYRQLFLADTPLNPALARFYGDSRRFGLVSHPYLLASLAFPENSSPIDRGVFLSRRLLGRPLKSPHKTIAVLGQVVAHADFAPDLTMREKISELTKSEDCQTCHTVINPLGFSLEHFDAVGRFRTHDRQSLIDSDARFEISPETTVQLGNARSIAEIAAHDTQAQRTFIIRLFEFLSKQAIAAYGADTLDDLHADFVANEFNMRQLLRDIAVRVAGFEGDISE
jgi:hypothetical protein